MNAMTKFPDSDRYARTIEASKAVHWDIERDVIRGRQFTLDQKYLPDGLSMVQEFPGLSAADKRFAGQVQGRTYANIFGLVERFITAKLLEIGREHSFGDQFALEALVRFSDEELKHQALFRRIHTMMEDVMPEGYRFDIDPDEVARFVLSKSTWAVLLLTMHIELFVQNHYRQSIDPDPDVSGLFKDVFLYHWKDECQHVVLDELEIKRHDRAISPAERDRGVDDFIALVAGVDGLLQAQAKADADYFAGHCGAAGDMTMSFLKAYRWQYIFSGATHPRFQRLVKSLMTEDQLERVNKALATIA